MSLTPELEKRVELVSMDGHFHDITIALYRKDHEGRPQYRGLRLPSSRPGRLLAGALA